MTLTASDAPAQSTKTYFDTRGRVWKTILADGSAVTNEYFLTGELKETRSWALKFDLTVYDPSALINLTTFFVPGP